MKYKIMKLLPRFLRFVLLTWVLVAGLMVEVGQSEPAREELPMNGRISDAVVKIYTVTAQPDYYRPWQQRITQGTGSGCIVAGGRILTNAHVVANQTFIEVRRNGHARRFEAEVLSVSHEADLALLTVKAPAFFAGVEPLGFGGLPEVQEEALVYGFPTGGDTLSITKGIVSRIEHVEYVHSNMHFLAGQIDAAINPGNSGGPVLAGGKLVGVAMQGRRDADNIGYLIPVPVIRHFLRDIEDGRYDGFPDLGLVTQEMENHNMRRKYGMPEEQSGVFVSHILPNSPAKGVLRTADIVLAVDGHPLADDGTVEFRPLERTNFAYYAELHQIGEPLRLTVLREGKAMEVTLTLDAIAADHLLVPTKQYDTLPRYFIFGGIVFSPLTTNLLAAWGDKWRNRAPTRLVMEASNWQTEEKQEVVVALQVLASDINMGYHDVSSRIVEEVNGKPYRDFNEFFRLVSETKEPFVVFTDRLQYQIVIDRQKALESQENILQTYRIPSDRSTDLMWSAAKGAGATF